MRSFAQTLRRSGLGPAIAAAGLFLLFAVNFGSYRVFGDGHDYYSFVQVLFGDREDGSGYNFGVGLLNAPFYAVGRLTEVVLGRDHAGSIAEGSITLAAFFYVTAAVFLAGKVLQEFGLSHRFVPLLGAVFGTPIWYYGSFSPSYSHAVDAAAFGLVAVLLLRAWKAPNDSPFPWLLVGTALGVAVAVRPYNVGLVAGACCALLVLRRARPAVLVGVGSVASYAALACIPLVLGTGLRERATGETVGSPDDPVTAGAEVFGFEPLTPLKMLFTLHRGLFVWTPLTLLGIAGVIYLARRQRHRRAEVALLLSMALGLLVMHVSLVFWDGGWSFSMRYFASLLPIYALGLGALLETEKRRLMNGVVALGCAWSVFLGMNHAFGASQSDGADDLVAAYLDGDRSAGDFADLTWSYSRGRHVLERLF